MEPFLHSDGESIIIHEAFDREVMEMFHTNLINYLKGGPSHTSKTQDLDCGYLFSSLKAGLETIAKKNIIEHNPTCEVPKLHILVLMVGSNKFY